MLMRPGSRTGETNGISEIHIVSAVATSGDLDPGRKDARSPLPGNWVINFRFTDITTTESSRVKSLDRTDRRKDKGWNYFRPEASRVESPVPLMRDWDWFLSAFRELFSGASGCQFRKYGDWARCLFYDAIH